MFLIVLVTQIVGLQYSFISVLFTGYLAQSEIPNYVVLSKVKCPSCSKNYFTPFLASKDDIKSLLKSNPKCVNCGYEAEIISDYKTMY